MAKDSTSPAVAQGHRKTYVLGMFPYPSGEGLHVGHVRIFTACDVMARYFRMKSQGSQGSDLSSTSLQSAERSEPWGQVLSPMGWDAFGLPAENAAIKAKKIPQEMVPHNYANFKKQMQNLSLDFDWSREFATTDPSYYATTQWIFLQLYKSFGPEHSGSVGERKRLVYREKVAINWCPKCKTGLANEEVLSDGTHERCGTLTGKKLLPQWVMRITAYAERLLNDLEMDLSVWFDRGAEHSRSACLRRQVGALHSGSVGDKKRSLDWPKGILEMQRNWIGKKEGVRIKFEIRNQKSEIQNLEVFTTRIDTIYGVSFVVISPEKAQEWIQAGWEASLEVKSYIKQAMEKSEQTRLEEAGEKSGVETGLVAVNPANEAEIPIWVADYVLSDVGTGAVMGVPFYDERDRMFASKYHLPIPEIELEDKERIFEKLEKQGVAEKETTYHLRDWVFSRQRYWGEPIPLVYCTECAQNQVKHSRSVGALHSGSVGNEEQEFEIVEKDGEMVAVVPLPEDQLPLELPKLESYEPTETGESPLSRVSEWVNTKCPKCGGPAKRETDTMPNWAGSCWYFLAFAFWKLGFKVPNSGPESSEPSKPSKTPYTNWWMKTALPEIKKWLPVDWYLGGAEHAVLHLLYARFWVKVLQDLKLLDFPEPFLRLRSVGMVLAEDGKKMSKSLGNVVNPDEMVAKYGSDAVRMYEMFMGPWEQSIAWDSGAISGQVRFLGRVRETVKRNRERLQSYEPCKEGERQGSELGVKTSPVLAAKLKTLVARVEEGVLTQKFNTAIAGLMEFVNEWRESPSHKASATEGGRVLSKEHVEMFASLLSLFAPITAGEILKWQKFGSSLRKDPNSRTGAELWGQWPDVSQIQGVDEVNVTIAVQVNGKLRGTIEMLNSECRIENKVVEMAMKDERVKKWLTGEIKKVIFVPGKLVNIVI